MVLQKRIDPRERVIAHLREAGASDVSELDGEPENVTFALPKELRLRVVA